MQIAKRAKASLDIFRLKDNALAEPEASGHGYHRSERRR
jgi:hypothetical protein